MSSVLHLSDIHFGPPHRPAVSAAAQRLVRERSPDLVVVSGDLTQRAKPYQFRQAKEFADSLDVATLVVPGNHDVPMYRFWERIFAPFGAYRKHFCKDLEPIFESDELLVVGINSAFNWTIKGGRVLASQLERVRKAFGQPSLEDPRCRIAVLHHPLLPVPGFKDPPAKNSRGLLAILAEANVSLVLSGHLHQLFDVDAGQVNGELTRSVHLFQSGTSSSVRGRGKEKGQCTAYWFEVDPSMILASALRYEESCRSFKELWKRELAR